MKQIYHQSSACHATQKLWPAVAEGKTHDTTGFQGFDKTFHQLVLALQSQSFLASLMPCNSSVVKKEQMQTVEGGQYLKQLQCDK